MRKKVKRSKPDLSDGVDYVRFSLHSEKGAPYGDFEPCDGSIRINLEDIWDDIKNMEYTNAENILIHKIIDVLGHEMDHKWFVWGMEDDAETFNEMDERTMRVIQDWIVFDNMKKPAQYD